MASTTEQKCNICEKYFPKEIFDLHQRVHVEDKFHPCNKKCGKVFTSKTDLLNHYCDGRDTGRKNECDICKKTFRHRIYLAGHKKIHTETKEKVFVDISIHESHKSNLNHCLLFKREKYFIAYQLFYFTPIKE